MEPVDLVKTNFIKWYLNTLKLDYIVFGKDSTEWREDKFIYHDQLNQIDFEKIHNRTIKLDDLGAFKNLKLIVEDLFRYGRHNNLHIVYLAHYIKDVLPIVRQNITKIYITLKNSKSFFSRFIDTYELNKNSIEKWIEYRNQNEFGIIELNTITTHYLIYNSEYNLVYNSKYNSNFDPANLVHHKSYFLQVKNSIN